MASLWDEATDPYAPRQQPDSSSLWGWLHSMLGNAGQQQQAEAGASQAAEPAVTGYLGDVASGRMAANAIPQDHYDPNRSFAQNALDPQALEQAQNIAMGFAGGGMATKARPPAASDLPAPNIGKGTATPLFDLSNLTQRPDVPQMPIERMPPPAKGVPDWFSSQIENPATAEQYKAVLAKGREVAGDQNALGWWNTFPMRDRYVGELGEQPGDALWRSDMNMLSATSPRHAWPPNIRQASYFGNILAEGRPLPELVKQYSEKNPNAYNWVPTESAPSGYANFPLHIQNIENLLQPDRLTLGNNYPLTNPKPASMAQNLTGNWSMPTIDVRDLRAMGLTTKGGQGMQSVDPASLYGYTEENFHKPLAKELDLNPAQMQSATWLGVPEYFSGYDRSGSGSALSTFEDSIRRTAEARGLTPEETFRRGWIKKEFPLLGLGGLGVSGLLSERKDAD